MCWRCLEDVSQVHKGVEEDQREEYAMGSSWGCGPIWTHQQECMEIKKKKTVDGPLGNREIYKESRRRVGNENWGGVIRGWEKSQEGEWKPQRVVSQKTGKEFQGASGQWNTFWILSVSWIRQDQDVGGLDGVMAMDAKLS